MSETCWVALGSIATAVIAVGTVGTAAVVGWYTWETRQLRKATQNQVKATVIPVLRMWQDTTGISHGHEFLDLSDGKPGPMLYLSNEGHGVALDGRLEVSATPVVTHPALGQVVPRTVARRLPAIPPGLKYMVLLPVEALAGEAAPPSTTKMLEIRVAIVYRDVLGQEYVSRAKIVGDKLDPSSTEFIAPEERH
jgi:hypothetical protein